MNISIAIPKPNVDVSRSRVVIGRSAGTVSSSGPLGRDEHATVGELGEQPVDGSSSPSSRPSSITARVAAAVIG